MEEKRMEQAPVALRKTINGTTYLVRVHFNEESKEDMKAKVKKLMLRDLAAVG